MTVSFETLGMDRGHGYLRTTTAHGIADLKSSLES